MLQPASVYYKDNTSYASTNTKITPPPSIAREWTPIYTDITSLDTTGNPFATAQLVRIGQEYNLPCIKNVIEWKRPDWLPLSLPFSGGEGRRILHNKSVVRGLLHWVSLRWLIWSWLNWKAMILIQAATIMGRYKQQTIEWTSWIRTFWLNFKDRLLHPWQVWNSVSGLYVEDYEDVSMFHCCECSRSQGEWVLGLGSTNRSVELDKLSLTQLQIKIPYASLLLHIIKYFQIHEMIILVQHNL